MNLTEKYANKIVEWSTCNKMEITSEQKEILAYGYVLILENLYKTIVMVTLAVLTKTVWETLITIGSFVLLRSFAGGIHCRSGVGCTICMIAVWLIGLVVAWIEIPWTILFIMAVVVLTTVILYAPRSTKNNPIQSKKIKRQKHIGSIAVVIVAIAIGVYLGFYLGQLKMLNMILTSFLIEAFSILLLVEKEGEENEEQRSEGISC